MWSCYSSVCATSNSAKAVYAEMKPDQERVQTLLKDTVVLLCKNGLCFNAELKVQGLLGITLDGGDVFLVQIDETLTNQEDGLLNTADQIQSCQSDSLKCDLIDTSFDSTSQPAESPRRVPARSRRAKRRSDQPCIERSMKTSSNDSDIPLNAVVKSEAITMDSENSSDQVASGLVEPLQSKHCSGERNICGSLTQPPRSRRTVRRRTVASCRPLDISIDAGDKHELSFLDFSGQSFTAAIPRDKDALLSLVDLREDQFGVGNATYADCQEIPRFPTDPGDERIGVDKAEFVSNKLMLGDADQDLKMDPYGGGAWSSTETSGLDRKSFQCEYEGCGLSFYHSYTLYRHQRIKHGRRFGAVDQMSFFCSHPGCGRVFYRELALIKHQRAVHGN